MTTHTNGKMKLLVTVTGVLLTLMISVGGYWIARIEQHEQEYKEHITWGREVRISNEARLTALEAHYDEILRELQQLNEEVRALRKGK